MTEIHIETEYYANGQLKYESHLVNGKQHGPTRGWYENGQLHLEFFYENGLNHGYCRTWDKKGDLGLEMCFKHGLRHGVEREFDEKGNETQTYYFNDRIVRFNPEHAELMAAFLRNLNYRVESPTFEGPQFNV